MMMTLINARLAYRLSLANLGDAIAGPIIISCDMISANASLSTNEQLQPGAEMAGQKHQAFSLGPGESVSVTGELLLPIAAMLPIRSGGASLLAPLARFRIAVEDAGQQSRVITRIFVIGENPEIAGGRVRLFRIDRGPQIYSSISQREVRLPDE